MEKKIIGFTGTKLGMTEPQAQAFQDVLDELRRDCTLELHHGDCIGADEDANDIVIKLGNAQVIVHPPDNPKTRAYCAGSITILPERAYLDRNHDIVNACSILIACPKEDHEETLRSGTWATIRYAKKQNRDLILIWSDGKIQHWPDRALIPKRLQRK